MDIDIDIDIQKGTDVDINIKLYSLEFGTSASDVAGCTCCPQGSKCWESRFWNGCSIS